MSNFNEKMAQYKALVEENLKNYNSHTEVNEPQKNLIDAMNYSLEAGGKRIRPALVFAFCEALGGNTKNAVAPAAAIEMIHTFSLIHDDLPAMDNDDFRRGKPSCHEIIADSQELSSDQKVLIISVLANSVGRDGMIGGQVIDMENEERDDVTEEELRNMYRCKTGQLIAVSCVMGTICGEGGSIHMQAAAEYGLRIGLAFQIIDDILDITSTQEELGKPVGSDERENKRTLVSLLGIEKAQKIADKATSEALEWLDAFEDNAFLKELTETLLRRKN